MTNFVDRCLILTYALCAGPRSDRQDVRTGARIEEKCASLALRPRVTNHLPSNAQPGSPWMPVFETQWRCLREDDVAALDSQVSLHELVVLTMHVHF
eukprot:s1311_g17.t1